MHSVHDTLAGGLPHSDIYRSQLGYQLPVAFRRFQRLSSPLDAKSSTVCPYWLDHTDLMPTEIDSSTQRANDLPNLPARTTNPLPHHQAKAMIHGHHFDAF